MADEAEEAEEPELTEKQKSEIAKWFLVNAPVGEIQYVAKDVRALLRDDRLYEEAAAEAFPVFNKAHLLVLEMPGMSGDIIVSSFGEIDDNNYFDPRTGQVATVNHVKQVCTKVRPAYDEELPTAYVEQFRFALDAEICKYAGETYPKGTYAVYCTRGKDVDGPGSDFELAVVISASRTRPKNFCNGNWCSIWTLEFNDDLQSIEAKGKMQVFAHYFEEGNVQLDAKNECRDSTMMQSPDDCAVSISNIIRHHEAEYMTSLEESYLHLSDTTFKDLRRKLPVTRTLFPWHSTFQFSLTRDISRELGIGK
ncbi:hypothetical protein HPP92_002147 [Vanilla planifolia]|uniref:F-actin-capping protein subunit alpha n=1 Tax=Vanilla planifolia TaxID=51239 RepID=A0A835VI79_VANPL|nr:hypothetical protein HPP92_002147 [Vanilla planifolia]